MERRGEEFNHHHIFFQSSWYRGNFERKFRNQEGLVVPSIVIAHNALHRVLRPPHKPNREQMYALNAVLEDTPMTNRMSRVRAAEHFFYEAASSDNGQLREHAMNIAENLAWQMEYLCDGYDYDNPEGKLVYPKESLTI